MSQAVHRGKQFVLEPTSDILNRARLGKCRVDTDRYALEVDGNWARSLTFGAQDLGFGMSQVWRASFVDTDRRFMPFTEQIRS